MMGFVVDLKLNVGECHMTSHFKNRKYSNNCQLRNRGEIYAAYYLLLERHRLLKPVFNLKCTMNFFTVATK